MNLFWKQLLLKVQPTWRFEKKKTELMEKFNRYMHVEESQELAEYKQLYEVVHSQEFKDKKQELVNRKYKDTTYCRDLKRFNKLDRNYRLHFYFDTLETEELKAFLEFKATPEYRKLGSRKEVRKSEELKRFKAYEKSRAYKNYVRFHDTYVVEEYLRLKEIVSAPDFEEKNEFWANPHRWETVEEYGVEQRYKELAVNEDIVFHEKLDPAIFNDVKDLELTFCDEFNEHVKTKQWDNGFYYGESHKLKSNHSFVNERQANNDGKNTICDGQHLVIKTERETVTASAWDVEKGFVERDFDYTSDVIHTKDFAQERGVFTAKIRCKGRIHHAFWLSGADQKPHINVFHFNGKAITVGSAGKKDLEEGIITGLCPAMYYIYTLVWTKDELIWYINNYEVYRTHNDVPKGALHLLFNSFIPVSQKGRRGELVVDWVRVYKYK